MMTTSHVNAERTQPVTTGAAGVVMTGASEVVTTGPAQPVTTVPPVVAAPQSSWPFPQSS